MLTFHPHPFIALITFAFRKFSVHRIVLSTVRYFLISLFTYILIPLFPASSFSQEILTDLHFNPVIKSHLSKKYSTGISNKTIPAADTLTLPFLDDFSKPGIYPDQSLWTDSNAFINTDFPVNPITLGAATLDGLNPTGDPYSTVPSAQGVADKLTSKPIYLNKLPGDSIYLSFFYQSQGLGNAPEPEDSLVLEFYNPTVFSWVSVWSAAGSSLSSFELVLIPVTDTAWLKDGFQFRFKNYATLSGNVDHWHIDYVRLHENRTFKDTLLEDVAFLQRTPSLLKNFTSMPWSHFLASPPAHMKDSMIIGVRNNDTLVKNVSYYFKVLDSAGITTLHKFPTTGTSAYNINALSTTFLRSPQTYIFPSQAGNSAVFRVDNILNTVPDINPWNDTLRHYQSFGDYYSYDDGTAENGYGLTAIGAKLAYRFTLAKPDTLRAVQMHFTYVVNSMANKLFNLAVWSSLSPETIIYKKVDQKPAYADGFNGYYTYTIDTPLYVSGTIYIGWIQQSAETLNVGIDRNINSNSHMYYNTTGNWLNSIIPGSLMIRPVFGDKLVSVENLNAIQEKIISVYPSPATEILYIRYKNLPDEKYYFTFYDVTGRRVLNREGNAESIDITALSPGFYLLKITGESGTTIFTDKILVAR